MNSTTTNSDIIHAFNSLPRNPLAPSGQVPNHWHFDLRYMHFEPNPAHVLFFLQPDSEFIHMEAVPVGAMTHPGSRACIQFFPETAADAAAVVAEAIVHTFSGGLDGMSPFAPWRLTTEPKSLAIEVSKEFKRLGIHEGLQRIQLSPPAVIQKAQETFDGLLVRLKQTLGLEPIVFDSISTPTAITFCPLNDITSRETDEMNQLLGYAQDLDNSKPPIDKNNRNVMGIVNAASQHFAKKFSAEVKAEADGGNPESMLDIAMRLKYGIGCVPNRLLHRNYLVKAILSPRSSDAIKSTAHALLIDWYLTPVKQEIRTRYMFAACHHANQAIIFGRAAAASTAKSFAAPTVLRFLLYNYNGWVDMAPELVYWFKAAYRELEARQEEVAKETKAMNIKRMKNPNRYRCAAIGCGIESTTGKVLQTCSGPCDTDVKPHYCSKECQKKDWKNHKPFCKSGAPCSVIDAEFSQTSPLSHPGAVHVPIKNQDGSSFGISSATLDRNTLKEMRDSIEAKGGAAVFGGRNIQVEIREIN